MGLPCLAGHRLAACQGYVSNPGSKEKSVAVTEEGKARAEALFQQFCWFM